MPIYEYRCSSCGVQKDVLQKISDAPLTICAACGKPTFSKQLSAAGFQLKGSGWYATDFNDDKTFHLKIASFIEKMPIEFLNCELDLPALVSLRI